MRIQQTSTSQNRRTRKLPRMMLGEATVINLTRLAAATTIIFIWLHVAPDSAAIALPPIIVALYGHGAISELINRKD